MFTNLIKLRLKVSPEGAVVRFNDFVYVTDLRTKGFVAEVYEFIDSPEEAEECDRRLSKIAESDTTFRDTGHAIAWCMSVE